MRVLALVLLLTSICIGQSTESGSAPNPPAQAATPATSDKPSVSNLAQVKRIYVSSFGDDEISKQLQAMVVSSLVESKKFVVTENEKKADAILRGSGAYKSSQELHRYSSATAVGSSAIHDSSTNTETVESASISLRLVNTDGDIIWTTTQESKGAKFKGATAFVADKAVSQLSHDVEKASKPNSAQN